MQQIFDTTLYVLVYQCDVLVKHVHTRTKMCSFFTNFYVMPMSRIPNYTIVKIDGKGASVAKSSKFENKEKIYDAEIKRIDICLPLS